MQMLKTKNNKEEININNINSIYFDLKQAQLIANVSNQTLYTYSSDENNNVQMVKFKGKNYLHIDDINYIKNEVEVNRSVRNSTAITIEDTSVENEIDNLKAEINRLKEINEQLKNTLENKDIEINKLKDRVESLVDSEVKEKQNMVNYINEISQLKEELGELREFKRNSNNLNELIKTLSSEKDDLYNKQITNLVEANTDLMDKFDKLIDSQNAFQVMLAQKEQTSQKLIEDNKESKGFFSRLLKR